jgi:hypothetical protein
MLRARCTTHAGIAVVKGGHGQLEPRGDLRRRAIDARNQVVQERVPSVGIAMVTVDHFVFTLYTC